MRLLQRATHAVSSFLGKASAVLPDGDDIAGYQTGSGLEGTSQHLGRAPSGSVSMRSPKGIFQQVTSHRQLHLLHTWFRSYWKAVMYSTPLSQNSSHAWNQGWTRSMKRDLQHRSFNKACMSKPVLGSRKRLLYSAHDYLQHGRPVNLPGLLLGHLVFGTWF